MTEAVRSISVEEALEELEFPSFFETGERKSAYEYVMLWGDEQDKNRANTAIAKYPFENELEPRFS
jgi:hypothetical protein